MSVQFLSRSIEFSEAALPERPRFSFLKISDVVTEEVVLRSEPEEMDLDDFRPRWWPGEDIGEE